MKVLHLSSFYCKPYGGAEISIQLLINYLDRKDVDSTIFTLLRGNDIQDTYFKDEIVFSQYSPLLSKKLILLGNGLLDRVISIEIKKILFDFRPDVIHVHDTYMLPATLRALNNINIPSVLTYHNEVSSKYLILNVDVWWKKYLLKLLNHRNYSIICCAKKMDKIIAISDYIKNELVDNGINEENISTIYVGGLSSNSLSPVFNKNSHLNKVKLLTFGRIYKYKGFEFLIKSLTLLNDLSNIELNIAGRGPFLSELKKKVHSLGLESIVNFSGYIPDSDLRRNIIESDIVIFPTLCSEPFGRIALEGSYHGKPVIATSVGGIPESVIDGDTGFIVCPNDEKEMANAIQRLIDDKRLRERMGENGKKFIKNKFDNEKIVNQVIQLYRGLFDENRLN